MKRHQTTSMMHLHKLKPKDLIVLVKLSWKRMHNLSKLRKELSHHWVKVHTRKESPMDSKQGEKALVNRNRKLYEKQSKISNQKSRWLKDKHARHLKYCKHQNKRYAWKNNLLSYMKPKFIERELIPCHNLHWLWPLRHHCLMTASLRHNWFQGASTSRSHHPHLIHRRNWKCLRHQAVFTKHWARHCFFWLPGMQELSSRCKPRETWLISWMRRWDRRCTSHMTYAATSQLRGTSTRNHQLIFPLMRIQFPDVDASFTRTLTPASSQFPETP